MSRRIAIAVLGALALVAVGFGWSASRPTPAGPPQKITVESRTAVGAVLRRLEKTGVVRNAEWTRLSMRIGGAPAVVAPGVYEVSPGMDPSRLAAALRDPLAVLVTVPEGLWIARTAEILQAKGLPADEYVQATKEVELGRKTTGLKVPADSLEGYLFPDSYDWPPGTTAQAIVQSQLSAFAKKAVPVLKGQPDPHRTIVIGSLVELEAKRPEERARIAGVIENRLKKGMRLELDCSVLYGIQEWRQLMPGETKKLASPYNTYLNDGLPPGPVCSPGLASIKAAASPERHSHLYYVARPDGTHLFSNTYEQHRANIRRARAEAR